MAKEKQQPKGYKSKKILSNDAEMTLYGLMIFLVSLIGFLNRGIIGNFLTFIFVYLFGAFYFAFFLFAIFFGLYMVFKKKFFQIKINIRFLGVILIILSAIIGASLVSENLTISNVFVRFQSQIEFATVSGSFYHIDISKVGLTGGGIIGFFLAALLNVTITNIGGVLLVAILFIIGVYLVFASPIAKLYKFIKKCRVKNQNMDNKEEEIDEEKNIETKSSEVEINDVPNMKENSSISRMSISTPFQASIKSNPVLADDIDDEESNNDDVLSPIVEDDLDEDDKDIETQDSRNLESSILPTNNVNKVDINPFTVKTSPVESANNSQLEYEKPPLDLLETYPTESNQAANEEISIMRQEIINKTFRDFGIGASAVSFKIGPSITRFDINADSDVSVREIEKNIDDISVRLGGVYTRFERFVPGKTTTSIEVPNQYPSLVSLKEVLKSLENNDKKLLVPFGKDASGEVLSESMIEFPHLLVAGSTGTGKSVFVNSLITSLIMRESPDDVRLLLIDPKRVEFSIYADLPHLLCPIIKDDFEASKVAMKRLMVEMDNRFTILEKAKVNNIKKYNKQMELTGGKKMPYIVVIIDEYGDIVGRSRDIENSLMIITQKSRAAGIHVVLATQRPSSKIITSEIKANLQTRVALKVATPVDSIVILGKGGAERLIGKGDSLIDCASISKSQDDFLRVQGPFVDDFEIKRVVDYLSEKYEVHYDENFLNLKDRSAMGPTFFGEDKEVDEAYEAVKEFVMNREYVSISKIITTFNFGYPRASKIFTMLQNEGIVEKTLEGSTNSKGAKVLVRNVNNNDECEGETDD